MSEVSKKRSIGPTSERQTRSKIAKLNKDDGKPKNGNSSSGLSYENTPDRSDGYDSSASEPLSSTLGKAIAHADRKTAPVDDPTEAREEPSVEAENGNAFASLFPKKIAVLDGVLALTSIKENNDYTFRDIFPIINITEEYEPKTADRLLKCSAHPDNTAIKSPRAGIVNVALADPDSFSVKTDSDYLWSKAADSWVMSSLIGKTVHFSTGDFRQICIAPFKQGWYRFTSVLGQVFKHDVLHFQTFQGGVSFGAMNYGTHGNTTGIVSDPKILKKAERAPVRGSYLGRNDQIPVFDGRQQFQLGNYWNHPYEERVAKGSTVMVLFSIRKSALPKAMKNAPESIKFVVYLNLLGVIVLEEPVDEVAGGPSQEEPQAFGVNSVRRIEEFHTGKQNADEENSEGGETVLDEAFL